MFSKSAEYAIRATIYITQQSQNGKRVGVQKIADAIGSPKAFTAKILQQLTSKLEPFISSSSGPGGGFYITEEARQKSAWTILEAMGESDTLERCILGLPKCSDQNPCPMHYEYKSIKQALIGLWRRKSIDDLTKMGGQINQLLDDAG